MFLFRNQFAIAQRSMVPTSSPGLYLGVAVSPSLIAG